MGRELRDRSAGATENGRVNGGAGRGAFRVMDSVCWEAQMCAAASIEASNGS